MFDIFSPPEARNAYLERYLILFPFSDEKIIELAGQVPPGTPTEQSEAMLTLMRQAHMFPEQGETPIIIESE